ncbi:MAG: 4Fe-4S binding protein [Desulfobacterales bacterium]|nr:4Fe-4S binding protein [Desulfobacterales bacterium]
MESNIYKKLAHHLDHLPGGYPPTDTGVELKILKKLFTPDEAELMLHLTILPESPRIIAYRAKLPQDVVEKRLSELARKGCIVIHNRNSTINYIMSSVPIWIKKKILFFGLSEKEDVLYSAVNFVIGIWEFHLNSLDIELIKDVNEYMPFLMKEWIKLPQLRTIPIGKSLNPDLKILSYENAEALIKKHNKFVVAKCICRLEKQMMDEGCNKPLESCIMMGLAAEFYEYSGLGRAISLDECIEILKKAEKAGLVLQPSNYKDSTNICCCCGCCCGVLRNIKILPEPSKHIPSFFVNKFNPETCNGCGVCVKRCPMDAIKLLEDGKVFFDEKRCIGCGVCVPTCPTKSLSLVRKSNPPVIPNNMISAALKLAQNRGKMNALSITKLFLSSMIDRFMAP